VAQPLLQPIHLCPGSKCLCLQQMWTMTAGSTSTSSSSCCYLQYQGIPSQSQIKWMLPAGYSIPATVGYRASTAAEGNRQHSAVFIQQAHAARSLP